MLINFVVGCSIFDIVPILYASFRARVSLSSGGKGVNYYQKLMQCVEGFPVSHKSQSLLAIEVSKLRILTSLWD